MLHLGSLKNGGQVIPKVSWSLGVFSMYRNPIINHQFEDVLDVLDHHGSAISGKSLGMVYEIGLATRQITGFRRSSFDSPSDRRIGRRGWSMAMSRRRIMDALPFPFHGDSEDNWAILRPLVEMANLWNPALSTNLAGWHRYPQLPYGHTHPRHERKYHVSLHRRPAVQGTFFSCQPFRRLSSKSWERWGMRQSYQLFYQWKIADKEALGRWEKPMNSRTVKIPRGYIPTRLNVEFQKSQTEKYRKFICPNFGADNLVILVV